MKLSLSLGLLLVSSCAPFSSPSEDATLANSTVTLSFGADWSVRSSGPLVAGAPVLLSYAPARLPRCRATYQGLPAWGIVGSLAADGGRAVTVPVTTFQNGAVVPVDASFVVPFGRDLAVWFFNSDEYGCTGWDSSFGRDFHFPIAPSSHPVAHFRPDFSVAVDGELRAGQPFLVDYAIERLPLCRQTYNELQTWDVTVDARFDDGSTQHLTVTRLIDSVQRVAAAATLQAPAAARSVELWFENTDRTGCHTWDSDYGRNFRFELR